jgi:PAS domain S-box-containing protein
MAYVDPETRKHLQKTTVPNVAASSQSSTKVSPKGPLSVRRQLYLLIALGFALLVSGAAYEAYRQGLVRQEETGRDSLQLATITAADAERFLNETEQLLVRLSQRPLVRALDSRRCDPLIREFREVQPRYENILTSDLNGRALCSAASSEEGTATLDVRESLDRIVREPKFLIGKIRPGPAKGKWILPLSYPVLGDDNKVAGLVTLAVDLDRFPPLASRGRGPDQTVVAIDDGEGTVVGRRTEPEKTGEHPLPDLRKLTTTKVRNADGLERIYGYLPITGTEWKALVGIPVERIGSNAVASGLRYAFFAGALLILMALGALYLRRRMENPIHKFSETVRQISAGQFQLRIPTPDTAEFQKLGQDLNALLDTLSVERNSSEEVESKLQAVLREAGAAVYSITPGRDKVLFLSTTADRVFGRPVGDYYNNASLLYDCIHDDDREIMQAQYKQLLRGGAFDAEYRIQRPDGSLRWVHDRAWLVSDEAGRPARIDGFLMDISSRKQVDLTLRNSLQHFRGIAEASPVPLCVTSCPEGIIRYANDAFLKSFDVSREECVGQDIGSLFPEQDKQDHLVQSLVREGNLDLDLALRRHDGKILWVTASTRLATYDTEPAIYLALYDITARKQAEHSLRASEERFRTLIAALAEGVVLLDAAGRIVSCNAAAEAILGVDRQQLLGLMLGSPRWQPVREDGTPLTRHTHPAAVSLATGEPQRGAVVGVRRADDKQIWLSLNAEPQFHPDSSRPYSVIVSFLDITGQRLYEQALRQQSSSVPIGSTPVSDALVTIDADHRITMFSPLAEAMFGASAGDVHGQPLDTLIAEQEREALAGYLTSVGFAATKPLRLIGLRRDGSEFALEARVSRRSAGDQTSFTVFLRDLGSVANTESLQFQRKRRSAAPTS